MEKIWLEQYPDGIAADIDLKEYTSLADMFRRATQRYAEQTAFISFGRSMSYRTLVIWKIALA